VPGAPPCFIRSASPSSSSSRPASVGDAQNSSVTRPRQLLRSWYMFFFHSPGGPKRFSPLLTSASARVPSALQPPGTFTNEDLVQYRAAWSQPGALTAMINWYRALFRARVQFPDKTVRVPTRILWASATLSSWPRWPTKVCATAQAPNSSLRQRHALAPTRRARPRLPAPNRFLPKVTRHFGEPLFFSYNRPVISDMPKPACPVVQQYNRGSEVRE